MLSGELVQQWTPCSNCHLCVPITSSIYTNGSIPWKNDSITAISPTVGMRSPFSFQARLHMVVLLGKKTLVI